MSRLPTTHYPLPITHYPLPTTHYPLPITHYPLPSSHLSAQNHQISIDPIITAVTSYQPQTELIFAVESGTNLDIGWCQHLKISPPDCYQQICRRWSEFQLEGNG